MKTKQWFHLVARMLILVATLGLAGCNGSDDDDGPTDLNGPSSGNTYRLNPNVKMLEPGRIELVSQTESSMVLSGDVPGFRAGDVFVSTDDDPERRSGAGKLHHVHDRHTG